MSRILLGFALVASLLTPAIASAQVITFETTPAGGIPVDDLALTTPYTLLLGGTVSFYFDVNTNNAFDAGLDVPGLFERVGADSTDGFSHGGGTADTATVPFGPQLGGWFLRQPVPGSIPPPFLVDYNTAQTITGLSGEIWDIDGGQGQTEQWNVEVLNGAGAVLASLLSPLGNSQTTDGVPWTFAFSGLPIGVDKVRLTFVGNKTMGLGLAFNNFSPTFPVPEPSAIALAGLAVALASRRRR